ncbi:MAG TPA: flagellar type III secretion system protein FliR [Firmicutes bacterium]|nr:flagellar type III secretion system protein FliR [Bacillota bacterium]
MDLASFSALFDRYLLVLVRVSGFLGATPFFGSRTIPNQAKVALALVVAWFLLPLAQASAAGIRPGNPGAYALAVGSELLIGFALGYAVTLTFAALQIAGQLMDIPIGFSLVNVLDPLLSQQVPVLGQFQYILFTLMFLAVDGHHQLLRVLVKTFELVPLGAFRYTPELPGLMVRGFSDAFLLGFKLSLPVVAALFLTDVALGLVARAVPQMNVFVVGFPAKIAVGLAFVVLILPAYVGFVELAFGSDSDLYRLIEGILKGGALLGR